MVENLQIVFNIYDIYRKEGVRNFRESKFAVHLAAAALDHLMRYLRSHDHTGLLYLLERFVDFDVVVREAGGEEPPEKKMKAEKEKLDDLATETAELPVKTGARNIHGSFPVCTGFGDGIFSFLILPAGSLVPGLLSLHSFISLQGP